MCICSQWAKCLMRFSDLIFHGDTRETFQCDKLKMNISLPRIINSSRGQSHIYNLLSSSIMWNNHLFNQEDTLIGR